MKCWYIGEWALYDFLTPSWSFHAIADMDHLHQNGFARFKILCSQVSERVNERTCRNLLRIWPGGDIRNTDLQQYDRRQPQQSVAGIFVDPTSNDHLTTLTDHTKVKVKVKLWTPAIVPLTWVEFVTSSALQSRMWQLIANGTAAHYVDPRCS